MNRWIRPGLMLAFLFCSSVLFANRVVVHGTVKFANGIPVPNFPVLIQTDTLSSNTACRTYKSVVSSSNAVYEAALECTSTIVKVVVSYKDCNGNLVKVVKEVPATGVIEYNIVLCTPTACHAIFGFTGTNANPLNILFNSSSSTASSAYPDEIVSRIWSWGDGSALTDGNVLSPNHVFPKDGVYEVCLKITTRNGCVSYSCQKVTVTSPATSCVAYFYWEKTSNSHEWQFKDTSHAISGDEIISRRWTWGDGSAALEGNIKYPTHVFPGPGTYEVCLTIKTKLGCEKKVCKALVVPADGCKANFNFEFVTGATVPPNSFRFNSSTSTVGTPASDIIARRWDFGDGTILEGNNVNPLHTYKAPGIYNVCLTIKTGSGCYSNICKTVVVAAGCRALFKWEPVPGPIANPPLSYMAFYGGGSHGSAATSTIIGRRWTFGDGTSSTSLDSTVKHGYVHAGTYRVCLYIKTSDGCYDSVCNEVVVPQPPGTACVPGFAWKQEYLKFYFNSSVSAVATGDKIIKRIWRFGDGTIMDGNVVDPGHTYNHAGTYEVCLTIVTEGGCEQKICKNIYIGTCEAVFRFEPYTVAGAPLYVYKFFSGASHGSTPNYTVLGRRWTFGDGSVLETNDSNVVHKYDKPGQYEVCLTIKTSDGCYNTTCKTVNIPAATNVPQCQPYFVSTVTDLRALFNSEASKIAPGDSIIKRLWIFGDGTKEDGNHIKADHNYQHEGQYEVCLVIATKMGCEQRICKMIYVGSQQNKCYPGFRYENTNTRKIVFNSSGSFSTIANDSIVKRVWSFGDGTGLGDNVISPSHEYHYTGTYTVCLRIVTKGGCEATWCQQVKVEGQQYGDSSHVTLVTTYPNPAKWNLYAIIWTKHNSVPATLSVYDIYGALKWTKAIILPQGNSTWPVFVGNLPAGPYILRLQTQYGIQRLHFFKVN